MLSDRKTVFISYAWEGTSRAGVKMLADWLRAHDVNVLADDIFGEQPPPNGWRGWMTESIRKADIVLVVCTDRYRKLFEKEQDFAIKGGLGATWEGAIISQHLYNSGLYNTKFFPILPDGGEIQHCCGLI